MALTFAGITGPAPIAALQITTAIQATTIPTLDAFLVVRGAHTPATTVVLATDSGAPVIAATARAVTVTVYSVATVAVGALVHSADTAAHTVRPFGGVSRLSKLAIFPIDI